MTKIDIRNFIRNWKLGIGNFMNRFPRTFIAFLTIFAFLLGFFQGIFVFPYAKAASAGPSSPALDAARATAWDDPDDAYSSNNLYAVSGTDSTLKHDWFSYGFSLPGDAAIDGIEVRLEHKHKKNTDTGFITAQLRDSSGALVGTAKNGADDGHTAETTETLGGANDTWGAVLTPAVVNNSNFGVSLYYTKTAGGNANKVSLDHVTITVHYTVELITATASVDSAWVKGGTTGKNFVITVNNSAVSTAAIQWVKMTRPSANYTLTAGSATGWTASATASAVTFTGGSIAINSSAAFTVTGDAAAVDEAQTAWTVQADDAAGGTSPVNAPASPSGALNTGIDSTAPTNASISSVSADSSSQLTANAATASDSGSGLNSSPYWFDETTGGPGATDSSTWQSGTSWVDSGLLTSTQYCYQVKARDAVLNESVFSTAVCQTTQAGAPPSDTTAPAAVTNLAAGIPTASSIPLTWTAPGDDGNTGTAASYDVRYSTATITEVNWASATQATGEPSPGVAGTAQSFTVSGLSSNTSYYFALKTSDEVPNISGLSNVVSATTAAGAGGDTTPPSISFISSSVISTNAAFVTWTTNEPSDSQVEYGSGLSYGLSTTLDTTLVLSHSVSVGGLSANTTYNYRAKSRDSAGNLATSANFTFTTLAQPPKTPSDTSPPLISDVATITTPDTATITWNTNEPATSLVEYGKDVGAGISYELAMKKDLGLVKEHTVVIKSLPPDTSYNFQVVSEDFFGNIEVARNFTFKTKKPPPPPAPPAPPPAPVLANITVSAASPTSVKITWETDISATSQVLFGVKSGDLSQITLESQTLTKGHSRILQELAPGTVYYFVAVSRSDKGIEAKSKEQSFQTEKPAPPPSGPVISELKVVTVQPSSAKIQWTTNVDATSQVLFGTKSGSLTQVTIESQTLAKVHTKVLQDLTPGTSYYFAALSRSSQGVEGRSGESLFQTEKLEIQTVVEVVKPLALPPGSPGTQIPKIAAGETVTVVPILSTPGDAVSPQVTLFNFSENPTQNTSPTIKGKVQDSGGVIAGVSYSTDGGASWHPVGEIEGIGSSTSRFSAIIPNLRDGNYLILFRARDNSGNIGKSETKELVVDIKPPATGANVLLLGNQSLVPSSSGTLFVLAGLTLRMVTSAVGGAISVEIFAKKLSLADGAVLSFPMTYSKRADLWFGDITIDEPGEYQLEVRAADGGGRVSSRPMNPIAVAKPGIIQDTRTKKPVSQARVSIFQFSPEVQDFVLWPGEVFNQANPQVTGEDGSYRFVVPPGKYYLKVETDEYRTFYTTIMTFQSHQTVNLTLPLAPRGAVTLPLPFFGAEKLTLPSLPDFFGMKRIAAEPSLPPAPLIAKSLLGSPAPLFSLPDQSGNPIDIRYLRGKKTILTTWATWSPLAQVQVPILDQLQQNNQKDIHVLLLSLQESEGVIDTYLKRGGYQIPSVIDREGSITRLYPILTLPQHFFLDRKGVLRDAYVGFLNSEALQEKLDELNLIYQPSAPPSPPSAPVPAPTNPRLTILPSFGPVGTVVSVEGKGFTPGGKIESHLRKPDGQEFRALELGANDRGGYTHVINTQSLAPGIYSLWWIDVKSSKKTDTGEFIVTKLHQD